MSGHVDPSARNPTQVFYDRMSRVYDLLADSNEHLARERGIDVLACQPGEHVLVIGFGTGHSVVSLARVVGPAGKIIGLDVSEGMMKIARQRVASESVGDRVRLDLGDARELPYGPAEFEAVFIAFTLELFDAADIHRVLEQVRRVLKPGGRLGIVAMSSEHQETAMTEIYVWMHRHFPHWVDCQPIAVQAVLSQAGFVIERREALSIWGLPVAIVLAGNPLAQ
jgi:demethylmenaquinone methyltransferase/2-methoxy-6-polyprenyl-1,4-benzoquinol methylase